jgi:predicted MPP superfamily phosphohydrolase
VKRRTKKGLTFFDTLKAGAAVALITVCGGLRRALHETAVVDVVETDLPLADLPPAWDGLRIAVLADLHARTRRDVARIDQIVDMTLLAACDVIVLAGDIIASPTTIPDGLGRRLARLSAPLGVFAVLGNHDYPAPERVVGLLRLANIQTLVNSHDILERNGQTLCLAGVDDLRSGDPDPARAMAGVDPSIPHLLISHNPDLAEHLPEHYRVDAVLAGHSHGGQVRLWRWGPVVLPTLHAKYADGLIDGPRCPVYVSRGLGTAGLPIRFHCPPELSIITLRSRVTGHYESNAAISVSEEAETP